MKDSFIKCLVTALLTAFVCLLVFTSALYVSDSLKGKDNKFDETSATEALPAAEQLCTEEYPIIDGDVLRPIRSIIRFIETGETKFFLDAVDPKQTLAFDVTEKNAVLDLIKRKTAELLRDKTLSLIKFESLTGIDFELLGSNEIPNAEIPEKELKIKIAVRTDKETREFIINPRVRSINGRWYLEIPEIEELFQFRQEA